MTQPHSPSVDRLSGLLEHFRVRAQLFHSGALCGLNRFSADSGCGYLHVLRKGQLEVSHPGAPLLPARLTFNEPTLLLYPRPFTHHFHNPPRDGADFTCAQLVFEGGHAHPLVRTLPPLVAMPLAKVEGLDATLALLFAEADHVRCGQKLIADRLFEVALLQLLRWLLDHPEETGIQPGLIAGLSDAKLSKVLVALHETPGQTWSLERMAACAGMSRTGFANRFRDVMGSTPADYLTDWRLLLAQTRLKEGQPVKQIADDLGYANPSALSRVFASRLGMSPREWMKAQQVQAVGTN